MLLLLPVMLLILCNNSFSSTIDSLEWEPAYVEGPRDGAAVDVPAVNGDSSSFKDDSIHSDWAFSNLVFLFREVAGSILL